MKEIYFTDHSASLNHKFKKKLLALGSYALARGVPFFSNRIAEKILCTPVKSKAQAKIPEGFRTSYIEVMNKKVAIYEKGVSDKVVLFVHGWSGNAFNFKSFFKTYIDAGYKVITFDQIAHGNSEGDTSNYYFFYQTLEAVYQHLSIDNNIEAIIAHSMGTSASVGARLPSGVKLCFIAPVIPVFDSLYSSVKGFGLSGLMVKKFLSSYESRFDLDLTSIDPKELIKSVDNPLKIIHSIDDQYIRPQDNLPYYSEKQKVNIVNLDGLGHFRILKSKEVVDLSLEFINDKN